MTVAFGCDVRMRQDCWQKVLFSHVDCSLKWKKHVFLRHYVFVKVDTPAPPPKKNSEIGMSQENGHCSNT